MAVPRGYFRSRGTDYSIDHGCRGMRLWLKDEGGREEFHHRDTKVTEQREEKKEKKSESHAEPRRTRRRQDFPEFIPDFADEKGNRLELLYCIS